MDCVAVGVGLIVVDTGEASGTTLAICVPTFCVVYIIVQGHLFKGCLFGTIIGYFAEI